jgi:hypothetical protein
VCVCMYVCMYVQVMFASYCLDADCIHECIHVHVSLSASVQRVRAIFSHTSTEYMRECVYERLYTVCVPCSHMPQIVSHRIHA